MYLFVSVYDDDDDGAVVDLIRPSNVHAYTREVRPEHGRYRVERKAYSNYGTNHLLVSELPTDHGSELPIDLCLELFYTSLSMRMLNN